MMRVSLLALSPAPLFQSRKNNVPLSVTIKPANNVPGSFEYQTDSQTLLRMLHHETDLSELTLEAFQSNLLVSTKARLPAITLREETLRDIGYFID